MSINIAIDLVCTSANANTKALNTVGLHFLPHAVLIHDFGVIFKVGSPPLPGTLLGEYDYVPLPGKQMLMLMARVAR